MKRDSRHVAVIGAGIVGVSTALWLQRAGVRVTLIDREGVASGTSFGNAGVLAASAVVPVTVPGLLFKAPAMLLDPDQPLFLKWSYFPKLLPFLVRFLSHANHKDLDRISRGTAELMHDTYEQHVMLSKGTGAEGFVEASDYVFLYPDEAAFNKDQLGWKVRRDRGFRDEELDADGLAKYDPQLEGRFGFAVRCLDQGRITDPGAYTKALADHFLGQGGELVIAEVTDIRTEGNRAVAVETPQGSIEADDFVLTTGAWSKKLAARLGTNVPLETERGYHLEFVNSNIDLRSPVMVTEKKFAINSMVGRLRCAGIVELGGLKAPPSKAPFELLERNARQIFPELEYESVRQWMGHRPSTSDSLPLIGAFAGAANVWAGFGHQHLGLTGGPKTGRWLSQLITGETPNVDLSRWNPNRFGARG